MCSGCGKDRNTRALRDAPGEPLLGSVYSANVLLVLIKSSFGDNARVTVLLAYLFQALSRLSCQFSFLP